MKKTHVSIDTGFDVLLLEIIEMPGLTWCRCGPATGPFKGKHHYTAAYHHKMQRWSWSRVGSAIDGRWCLPDRKPQILRRLETELRAMGIVLPGK